MNRNRTDAGTPIRSEGLRRDADDEPLRRQLRLRPVHRTVLTIATGLLCGILLVGTAFVLLGVPRGSIDELRHRVDVAEQALTLTHQSLGEGSDQFRLAFASESAAQRNELIAAASTSNAAQADAWKTYKEVELDLPGEAALRAHYDAGVVKQTQDVLNLLALLNSAPNEPAALAAQTAPLVQANRALLVQVEELRALYTARENALLRDVSSEMDRVLIGLVIVFALLGALWAPIIFITMRGATTEERMLRGALQQRHETTRRAQLDSRVQRALEMIRTEDGAYGVITEVMSATLPPDHLGEFLVADSSRAHFRQVSGTGPDGAGPGCPVGGPADCPATNGGQTLVFSNGTRFDACPWLRDRTDGPCSATCVPVAIAGRTIGVLHVTAPADAPPEDTTVQDLELLARKSGERIGMLRAFARTETAARTDPLTGLLNRRSLENRVRRLTEQSVPYVIAFADLDHFKDLNTTYGHETGDRALRIFARTLRDSIRPDDIPARWGGEEFVTLLPDCRVEDAQIVAERLRQRLVWVLEKGDVPPFTVSVGLAASEDGVPFSEVLAAADEALLQAKIDGRDAIVVAPPRHGPPHPDPSIRALPMRPAGASTAV
jgi:diguanylate cyclase (GGDEF)-like protein